MNLIKLLGIHLSCKREPPISTNAIPMSGRVHRLHHGVTNPHPYTSNSNSNNGRRSLSLAVQLKSSIPGLSAPRMSSSRCISISMMIASNRRCLKMQVGDNISLKLS